MENLEKLKLQWGQLNQQTPAERMPDKTGWEDIVRQRTNRQRNLSMRYFWGSFFLNLIVYSFATHVLIRYWGEADAVWPAIALIALHVPLTILLILKFRRIAVLTVAKTGVPAASMKDYVDRQHALLSAFYRFKNVYDVVLVPVSAACLLWIVFSLYVPGGVVAYPFAAGVLYALTILSCYYAITKENKKLFTEPIEQLRKISEELAM